MEIYVVVHDTYMEQNVFFTNKAAAQEYLEKAVADGAPPTPGFWRIEKLTEGVKFEADELYRIRDKHPIDVYGNPVVSIK